MLKQQESFRSTRPAVKGPDQLLLHRFANQRSLFCGKMFASLSLKFELSWSPQNRKDFPDIELAEQRHKEKEPPYSVNRKRLSV
jgi:hypothetical protein